MEKTAAIFVLSLAISSVLLLTSGHQFAGGLMVSVAAFSLLWGLSLVLRDASVVDIFWGLGFVLVGGYYLITTDPDSGLRGWLVMALVALWAIRLALHIGLRNIGAGEDFRYRTWREQSGRWFWLVSFFKVFLLQALVLWVVSSPLLLAQLPGPRAGLSVLDLIGISLFVVGFLFEAIADRQLRRFKSDPNNSGKILRTGLWSRSRHPNYFGEAVLWWGLGLLAVPTGGWLALVGPTMITFLLVKISGVAMLDAALVERRPGYAEYIATTPAFVPRLSLRSRTPRSLA
jgi:steroid 5-alpha reductase family enzyme